jgi:hypothetical protein
MVMGVPVGDDAFVAAVMAKKVRGTVSKINSTFESLRNSHKQTLHCIAYYCLNSLFDHWLQGLLPQHSVAHARLVDDALDSVLRHTLVPGALDDPLTLRRLRMPARHGGIGFRACADTGTEFAVKRLAGFIGSVNQAIPRMLDVTSKDGVVIAGYSNGLAPLLGVGSFDENEGERYADLIAGDSLLGAQIVSAWTTLQDGASPPDMVAPRAGLLSAAADDLGFGTAHLQRELTKEVEDCRSLDLSRVISELPAGNPKRESYEECRGDPVMRGWVYSYPGYGHSVPKEAQGRAEPKEGCLTKRLLD